ncbi:MAG: alpha-glucan family phosphorylase [Chthonomonas sp.]|nr:alpha-glucan family phosphorylase [Chthonomonas sp.]
MLLDSIKTAPHSTLCVPAELADLQRLAFNFWSTWDPGAVALFRSIAPARWDAGIGPVQLLAESTHLDHLASDAAFMQLLNEVARRFEAMLATQPAAPARMEHTRPVAYFCAEYGLHESFAQYSGGLGILAGDHTKEASDFGLPFVGIGCFYRLGFFRQILDPNGRQEHLYPEFDAALCPVERVLHPRDGTPLTIQVEMPGRNVHVAVWKVSVGRTPLLLLDTNVSENDAADRAITAQLYMRGRDMRFIQELILGVGGVRVLRALGIEPSVYHMNEGHSALLLVERLREAVTTGASFAQAQRSIRSQSVLTIHTPVPAGNERFDAKLVKHTLVPMLEGCSIRPPALLKLGIGDDGDAKVFDMTAFALRLSRAANGVSLLHGRTANDTWRSVVGLGVSGVTNGVHMPTWLGPHMRETFERAGADILGGTHLKLKERKDARATWDGVHEISNADLWQAHCEQKRVLIELANSRLLRQFTRHGRSPDELRVLTQQLNPEAFIIGFARRFAPYKRASLLFRDPKRLMRILNNRDQPVQVVFAGKAHPADTEGQALIAEVYRFTQDPRFRGKVFLIEDYDMAVGRAMVQGVDLWINNPRRPLEASGTSGMKAAANGVPNASILDGWWDEACEEGNGFAVGQRADQRNLRMQDRFDGESLLATLEQHVLPRYAKRDAAGIPLDWVKIMKGSIATSLYAFSTRRMLEDYVQEIYATDSTSSSGV